MKYVLLFICVLCLTSPIFGQNNTRKNEGTWLTFSNKIMMSNKFYSNVVIQQRRINFLKNTQAILVAPSLNYAITPHLSFGLGYMKFTIFPSGSSNLIKKNENRFFQDVLLSASNTNFKFTNRFRFEQRKIENISNAQVIGYKKVNRIRYRFEISKKLLPLKNNNSLIGKLSNEVRIRLKQGLTSPEFDQNNFALLLGTTITKQTKIWLGYGNYLFKKNENDYLQNHLLHITLSHTIDFRN